MREAAQGATRCAACGRAIEVCFCCDEPDCSAPACYRCLNVSVRQARPQPYVWEDDSYATISH
jgi:hypothetical protein